MDPAIRVAEIPASRGARWLPEAFALFKAAPLAWIGLASGWFILLFGALVLPLLGPVLVHLLQPVFYASFAIAAYRQAQGERIVMGDLFLGFKRNVRALFNLGMIAAVLQIGIVLLMNAIGMPGWPAERPFDLREYVDMLREEPAPLWVGFGLMLLVSGAFWFAPQLIAFHGISTSHAIRWSVYAALANLGPMLVYGVTLFIAFFLAWIPFGLGILVLAPLFIISTYVGYREVFEPPPPPPDGEQK